MSDSIDAVVVGGGVIGLACARALARHGLGVVVVERHRYFGMEISARNSGVIHSGVYYPRGSLKAQLCVEGRRQLYEYCHEHGIPHRRAGKLIVAQEEQREALEALHRNGLANGVDDLRWLEAGDVAQLEPSVRCAAAVLSPSTGIVDVAAYVGALVADVEASGGDAVADTEWLGATAHDAGFTCRLRSVGEDSAIDCRYLVNSAGLGATSLLGAIEGYPPDRRRAGFYAKGSYFVCRRGRPFSHLVYPMPNDAGLGVHATLDLDGSTRFGPDVEWVDRIDYAVDEDRVDGFRHAIREYWPDLPEDALAPGYAGIRPKLAGPGQPAADFVIEDADAHGVQGLINLLGIESPGLTASLAIGDEVRRRLTA